jgi:hypothetical protein
MPTIPYTAQNFNSHWGALLKGYHPLSVTWEELVWSAITVGKPGIAELFSHGWYSLNDVIVRSHMIYANLRQTLSRFEKSTLYDSLDPTEKGATSYFVGMMAAKLVAARLLNTPWLFHLSRFKQDGGMLTLKGNSQPDLIGLNGRRDWIIIEAKGRTNGFSSDALLKAKAQTRKLRQINGQFPALRVGIQAYFSPCLELMLDDPEPEEFDDDAVDVVAEQADLLRGYYSFAHSVTRGSNDVRTVLGRQYAFYRVEDVGLTIGLDRSIQSSFDDSGICDIVGKLRRADEPAVLKDGAFTTFPDGIAIQLDGRWTKNLMLRQPGMRNG